MCVVSCRALKLHGGVELDVLEEENIEAVKTGFENPRIHIENLQKFGLPVIVALNRFPQDTSGELAAVLDLCDEMGVPSELSEVAVSGGNGGIDLATKLLEIIEKDNADFTPLYNVDLGIKEKIAKIASEIYRADAVEYSEKADAEIIKLEKAGLDKLPLCIAKTQLSISDNSKLLGAPSGFTVKVKDIKISNGAGFLVIVTGKIMLMPGMPSKSTVEKIDIDPDGTIHNLA